MTTTQEQYAPKFTGGDKHVAVGKPAAIDISAHYDRVRELPYPKHVRFTNNLDRDVEISYHLNDKAEPCIVVSEPLDVEEDSLTSEQLMEQVEAYTAEHKMRHGRYPSNQDEFARQMDNPETQKKITDYTVLGTAEEGFAMIVGDCEGYSCWINEAGGMPLMSKDMDDVAGSQITIYIQDGEIRAI